MSNLVNIGKPKEIGQPVLSPIGRHQRTNENRIDNFQAERNHRFNRYLKIPYAKRAEIAPGAKRELLGM
jgi:hypothetical protein